MQPKNRPTIPERFTATRSYTDEETLRRSVRDPWYNARVLAYDDAASHDGTCRTGLLNLTWGQIARRHMQDLPDFSMTAKNFMKIQTQSYGQLTATRPDIHDHLIKQYSHEFDDTLESTLQGMYVAASLGRTAFNGYITIRARRDHMPEGEVLGGWHRNLGAIALNLHTLKLAQATGKRLPTGLRVEILIPDSNGLPVNHQTTILHKQY